MTPEDALALLQAHPEGIYRADLKAYGISDRKFRAALELVKLKYLVRIIPNPYRLVDQSNPVHIEQERAYYARQFAAVWRQKQLLTIQAKRAGCDDIIPIDWRSHD